MDKLYRILKNNPNCRILLSYSKDSNTLRIVVSSSESNSVPGMSADEIRTVFGVSRKLTISVNIPGGVIDDKGVDRMMCELEWAVDELKSFEKC